MAANPTTTHVIEIEAGIGEPAFIPLSMGHELQPISVGKKGMWRIESPRVLDVHAFVYFDGTSLFLQSADDANAASVDGYRIGKAWTELTAPCKIEIGQARLQFRSLMADADDQATQIAASPPVASPSGGPGGSVPNQGPYNSPFKNGSQPGASMPVAVAAAPPPPVTRLNTGPQPLPQHGDSSNPPIAFPKGERPFKPGEFAAQQDDESTRIAPLESTGAGRIASGSHPRPGPGDGPVFVNSGPMMVQGPMAAPVQPLQFPPSPGSDPQLAQQGGFDQGGPMTPMQPAMMGGGMMGQVPLAPGSYPGQGPQGSFPGQGQPYGNGSAPYGTPNNPAPYGTPNMPPNGMPMPNGMYPQQPIGPGPLDVPQPGTQAQAAKPLSASDKLRAKLGGTSPFTLGAGLLIIGAGLFILQDDDPPPPPKRAHAKTDAGAASAASVPTTPPVVVGSVVAPPRNDAGTTAAGGASGQSPWPAGVPCPPPGWPAGTPLPCTPSNGGTTATAADAGTTGPGTKPEKSDPPPGTTRGGKPSTPTLERQAVDYVASGNTAKAAETYEELVRREPNNRVYAEAARILRAKLDGGVSP